MDDNNNSNDNISNQERQRQDIKNLLSGGSNSTSRPIRPNTSTATSAAPSITLNSPNTTTTTSSNLPPTAPTITAATATTTTTNNNNNENNSNDNTTQPPLREDKLKLAVSFLSSPKVQTADKVKKTAFLKQKGLTDQEIEEAYKRTEGGQTTSPTNNPSITTETTTQRPVTSSTLAPIVPTRPPVTRPTQIIYYSAAEPERLSIQKMIGLALFFGIGTVGLTSSLLGIVKVIYSFLSFFF
ncbi:peroxisomal membrane anchor protein conserved region-domain-containing protein [Cunninghamella echinulata]|nr:peroxisomal membrane anchor protein conserved region-domain-containing protein [Cunninghamella echinulata]